MTEAARPSAIAATHLASFPRPLWAVGRGRGLRAPARQRISPTELQESFAPAGARPRPQPPLTRGEGMHSDSTETHVSYSSPTQRGRLREGASANRMAG